MANSRNPKRKGHDASPSLKRSHGGVTMCLTTHDDNAARLELSRQATLEISKLAEAASNVCQDEDQPIFHGIMARITTLSEVIYYAQRLHGDSEGSEPDIQALQRVFEGLLA